MQCILVSLCRKLSVSISATNLTDNRQTHSQQFPTNHHLSVGQALAVYNLLVQRQTMPAHQLFVIGHGANHPVVSNASEEGKRRNRRIEVVVYPERIAGR